MKFILAKKIGMTTIHKEDGTAENVTLLEARDNIVTQVRNEEKDGYRAIQLGYKRNSAKKGREYLNKSEFKNAETELKEKEAVTLEQFQEGDKVEATGTSKAKGFQGVVKKWGFAGSPASHGHRHDLRAPGSIGGMYPQKVFKGKKMAGRMGGKQKTVKNLEVVLVDNENKLLALKGAVPGNNKSIVKIYSSRR
ncbi:MAG: 50S ribosomal protein L3 [Candidatus Moranbacteria bacterium]|nr:50S ribosomal protein L3 [Candidatus Moranbacteria bacterium]